MRLLWSLEGVSLTNSWLTIGSFDGVHLGHQEIIRILTDGATRAGHQSVVVTFFPHPSVILNKLDNFFYLTSPEQRASYLGNLGVDVVVTHPFDGIIAQLPPDEFVTYLHKHLQFRKLLVGKDFALGRNRQGNTKFLTELGKKIGYEIMLIEPITLDGIMVSSSRIRKCLSHGDIELVNRLLGKAYHIEGQVISGDGRGRLIGIPTANLDVWNDKMIPKLGVYVCRANVEGQKHLAVVNIGSRPTFEKEPVSPRIEAHLVGFKGNLYEKSMSLDFIYRLRDEQKFSNKEALVEQVHRDIEQAINLVK